MEGMARGLLLASSAICALGSAAPADEHGQPPMVRIPQLPGKVQIDGRLTDAIWKKAAVCTGFVLLDGKSRPPNPTEARIFYDKKGLCIGFTCHQPNLPVVRVTERDGTVYGDDSVEVFLDVGCTGRGYYHVMVNAANVVRDELVQDPAWNCGLQSDTVRATDHWSCEIYIPFASIGLTQPAQTPLGVNLCRNDAAPNVSSSWAGLEGGFHQPDAFGLALLGQRDEKVTASILRVEPTGAGLARRVALRVANRGSKPFSGTVSLARLDRSDQATGKDLQIPAGQSWTGALTVGFDKPGRYGVLALVKTSGGLAAAVRGSVQISAMRHQAFGYPMKATDVADVWWCEGTYKVGRDRPAPSGPAQPMRVTAARNEYEPVQLIVRPKRAIRGLTAKIDGLPDGITAEICSVHYVKVTSPSDAFGARDWYPDALPPMTAPIDVAPDRNQPLWITFHVSANAKAGEHACRAVLSAEGKGLATVPIAIGVFDFTLPAETHTETAYGMHVDRSWHGPLSAEQYQEVWGKYLTNLARHRIACYRPTGPVGIGVKIIDADKGQVELDFTEYDQAAAYCYDELKINTFNFPYAAVPGKIGKFARGTPGYDRLHRQMQGGIARHLAAKKWLPKCYAYWVDEPSPDTYDRVKAGMDLLHRHCPGLRTLLTFNHDKAPVPSFYGLIDVWVPLLSLYHHQRARERQALGERVWWYVCCGPRHPYPNNFIDHPAIHHRIRFWMMEKYRVDGSLYWSTTYWRNKNPWQDPMSYRPKKDGTWGNGDGYLLYPPVREPSKAPVLAGPINTIRLALLREGLEDREYFWLLKQHLKGKDHPALHLPDKLIRSLTDFETNPQRLYAARQALARAVEAASGRKAE